jgi:hypothetical protein
LSTRPPNFAYLLIGLLVTLLLKPLSEEFFQSGLQLWTQVSFTATVIVSVFSLMDSRRWLIAGITLALIAIGGTLTSALSSVPRGEMITVGALLVFCAMALVFSFRHLIAPGRVDANRITGAVSVYLLAGVMLSLINLILYLAVPGSFRGIQPGGDTSELVYYTFVTMTTLGYGDITPAGPLAQALAYLTAIAGQFYIAILVALLVGAYISQQRESGQ